MKVGDLVKWNSDMFFDNGEIGIVLRVWKDPLWVYYQVLVLWSNGSTSRQSITSLEVINEGR